ncbi:unnamed protein product [Toxocara canis]|uniref:MFS domain-containing protein n=1 Tax=Toxocara canis TaxID=6265 RepID=A0A183UC19_TOXCA|nr:unnamed protein product [Toxocara canis]
MSGSPRHTSAAHLLLLIKRRVNCAANKCGLFSASRAGCTKCRAHASIFVMFLINLLNYTDRFTLAGVLTEVQKHFAVDDAKIGLLQTVFIIFYMSSALICGFLGDRYNRKWLMTIGVASWISSVFASSFIPGHLFYVFLAFRGVLGIGEACYFTVVPSLIADMFVASVRARALMFFYFAAPLGSGFGYMFGSLMNSLLNSWVWGLRFTPILGVICLILIVSTIREPQRGEAEAATGATTVDLIEKSSYCSDIISLLKIPTYVSASVAYTAVVFVMVSLSWWGPTSICYAVAMNAKLNSTDDISNPKKAQYVLVNIYFGTIYGTQWINFFFGLITIIGGLSGVIIGSIWAQMWSSGKWCFRFLRTNRANALVCALGSFMATPLLFFGLCFMDGNMTAAWDVVTPTRRSVANACQIFISNLFGGAVGPYVVGLVSDRIRGSDNSPTARFNGVQKAFYVLNCVLLVSGSLFVVAALFFKRDHLRFRKEMGKCSPVNVSNRWHY